MYAKKVWFDPENIYVETIDGKTGQMPLSWFPKLRNATTEEQGSYELWADGSWIHWEQLGEDLSAEGFFTFKKKRAQS